MVNSIIANTPAWLLVFARMGGLLGMNPLFARRNVPAAVRAGLTFLMTTLLAPNVVLAAPAINGSLDLFLAICKELLVGLCCGMVFQIYYYMLFFAGDVMDVGFGLSMAKVFDPATSIQMSISGTIFNLMFGLYIFATDSHLLMIRIFSTSFDILPVGGVQFSQESWRFFLELFIAVFSLALRLALPFMAAEFIMDLSMGVLMKLIPQIHVFMINMQFKVTLGFLLLLAFTGPITSFIDNYMHLMLDQMQQVFAALGG